MDINKNKETSSESFDDIDQKIHANQVLYDQLHQSLVDEVITTAEENRDKENQETNPILDQYNAQQDQITGQ